MRRSRFDPRSRLPLDVARTVAQGVRERLTTLLGVGSEVVLVGPLVPTDAARTVLFADAHVMRASGFRADAYAVVRQPDARRLIALAFGESAAGRASEIELRVLERIMANLLALCEPLCGPVHAIRRDRADAIVDDCRAYFEVRLVGGATVSFGFAFTGEPAAVPQASLRLADLRDVRAQVRAQLGVATLTARRFAALRVGDVIPLHTRLDDDGALLVGDVRLLAGVCGEHAGRAAFLVRAPVGATA